MLKPEIVQLLNEQVTKELYSAYFYLGISCYYEEATLKGFANWFTVQTQEERDHAMLMLQYLQNSGAHISLADVKARPADFQDFEQPLTAAYEHEQFVTQSIRAIYAEAVSGQDYQTMQFLDWFIKEQAEEEKNTDDLVKRFALFGRDARGLYLMDSELAARVYAPPTLTLA